MASQSPAALAEILGVSVASLTPTASPSPAPQVEITETDEIESGSSTPNDPRTADETISTSTLSVSDYFRQKMREKMLARQGASGVSNGDLPEGSLARVKEEVKVAVGGVEWEGSRVTFAEVKDEEDVKPVLPVEDVKPTLPIEETKPVASTSDTDKTARRLAKEERKRQKEAERAKRHTADQPDIKPVLPVEATEEAKSALSKEERRRQKEEKRASKEARRASKSGDKRKRDGDESGEGKKSRKDTSS